MKYRGKIEVEGTASTGNTSKVTGKGEFGATHKSIGNTLADSTPEAMGHAMDSAVQMHKEYKSYNKKYQR